MKRPRVWTVAEFAAHAGISHRRARRMLLRLDQKWNGELLQRSAGTNREYSFYPAVLARLEPDLFSPIESLEFRMDEQEATLESYSDTLREFRQQLNMLAVQTGANTRAISKHGEQLKLFRRAG